MQVASRTAVQRSMQEGKDGGNFVLHAMKKNREMLIKHCKQRAEENIAPVNLFNLDSKEYKIEQCF